MEIIAFFDRQKENNKNLVVDSTLSSYKLFARKHLELHTKLSYIASETQCYKYLISNNEPVNDAIVFERYLECFAYIINIGIDRNYDTIKEVTIRANEYCLSDQLLNLFIDLNDLIISPSEDHYITLVEDFLSLGHTLGYSASKIEESFMSL